MPGRVGDGCCPCLLRDLCIRLPWECAEEDRCPVAEWVMCSFVETVQMHPIVVVPMSTPHCTALVVIQSLHVLQVPFTGETQRAGTCLD